MGIFLALFFSLIVVATTNNSVEIEQKKEEKIEINTNAPPKNKLIISESKSEPKKSKKKWPTCGNPTSQKL